MGIPSLQIYIETNPEATGNTSSEMVYRIQSFLQQSQPSKYPMR